MPKVKKKRSKAGSHKRRVDRQLVGLTMSWFDEDPDSDGSIIYPVLSHKLPMMRPMAKRVWEENIGYLKQKSLFRWLVTVTGVYDDPKGERRCPVELEAKCVLEDMRAHVKGAIDAVRERGNRKLFKRVEFEIECLGL